MTEENVQSADTDDAVSQKTTADANDDGAAQKETEPGLDEILKEFETETETDVTKSQDDSKETSEPTSEQPTIDPAQFDELKARLDKFDQREADRQFTEVADALRAETDRNDRVAKAWLNAIAMEDERVATAYTQRLQKPQAWAKVQTKLKADFEAEFGKKVDPQATESRDAVAAAVRGSSTAAPDDEFPSEEEVMGMTPEDFNELQRKHGVPPL